MVQYLSCIYCNSVTATENNEAVCGTCQLLIADQQLDFEQSVREENEYWESNTNTVDSDQFEAQIRTEMLEDDQHLFLNRLRSNHNNEFFRSIYRNLDNNREEEELYENDQDDFDFNMSYQENIEAIREELIDDDGELSFESALDYSAIALRLLRVVGEVENDSSRAKGATESDIANLKTRTSDINDSETNIECAICTEKFDDLVITQLPCKHEYHSECIKYWLKLKDSCPICRQSISNAPPTMQEEEPDMIVITRETADRIRQNQPDSYMDDVD